MFTAANSRLIGMLFAVNIFVNLRETYNVRVDSVVACEIILKTTKESKIKSTRKYKIDGKIK
jgi:hypothetical protein